MSAKACATSPEVLLCIKTFFLRLVLFISAAAFFFHGWVAYTAILVVEEARCVPMAARAALIAPKLVNYAASAPLWLLEQVVVIFKQEHWENMLFHAAKSTKIRHKMGRGLMMGHYTLQEVLKNSFKSDFELIKVK